MAKTVILSEDVVRNLIEAHASMAAWYYQMGQAVRDAGVTVEDPGDAKRIAYVAQLASLYPELAQVARTITAPRPYVPPPAIAVPGQVKENEGVVVAPPPEDYQAAPAQVPTTQLESAGTPSATTPAPPPIVDPTKVKYD